MKTFRHILIDILGAGIALLVFALFHHVLPMRQESLGIVITPPATADTAESEAPPASETEEKSTDRKTVVADSASLTASAAKGTPRGRGGRSGGKSGSEKGGSALSGDEATDTAEADTTAVEDKFADKYSDIIVSTENSYSSPGVSVTVTENTLNNGKITYYVADIYLRDVTSFRTALANGTYGSGYRQEITAMAALNNALLAVNGDYYGNTTEGVVIRNGVIYRANPTNCDVCVLYYDGTMRVMSGSAFSVEEAVADGAWQAWTFGPSLLDTDGSAITSFSSSGRLISANPRTAIGYYEPGHYCVVVVDGRGDSAGITLPQFSQLFEDLGCAAAYNLDGGNSSVMVWNGEVRNNPSGGGRASSDALLITEVE